MAYKNVSEVKQFVVRGDLAFLNQFVLEKFQDGWEYVDSKVFSVDPHNNEFSVFYIFKK
jgi:hypothetical protein